MLSCHWLTAHVHVVSNDGDSLRGLRAPVRLNELLGTDCHNQLDDSSPCGRGRLAVLVDE